MKRLFVTLVIVLVGSSSLGADASGRVLQLNMDGLINPASAEWLKDSLRVAEQERYDLVLIQLNTPGGMLDSTREMVQLLLTSAVPVAVFVAPAGAHAASAGLFITLAAQFAAMAPGTNIGASTPIDSSGGDIAVGGEDLARKVLQDTMALMRSITEMRGRNMAWAMAAITEARSYTASEALAAGAIDFVAEDGRVLLQAMAGRTVTTPTGSRLLPARWGKVDPFLPSPAQRFMGWLAHPQVAYLLMMIGMVGLYFELSSPGAILPGVVGGISMLLAFASLNVLPFNLSGLLLLGLALVLMILEIFVTSGGILGAGGVVAFVLGSTLLFNRPDLDIGISLWTIGSVALFFILLMILVGRVIVKAHRYKTQTGQEGLVGTRVIVEQAISDGDSLLVEGELWSVRLAEGCHQIRSGAQVKIVAKEGVFLRIEEMEQ